MGFDCFSVAPYVPPLIGLALVVGLALGFSIRAAIDYAELAAYRRIARATPENTP